MNRIDRFKNTIYNFLDSERSCSKCKYLKDFVPLSSRILISRGAGIASSPKIKKCALSKQTFNEKLIYSNNCVSFKRRHGLSPIRQELRNSGRWLEKQWELHWRIITFTVTVALGIIAVLVTYSLQKGFL